MAADSAGVFIISVCIAFAFTVICAEIILLSLKVELVAVIIQVALGEVNLLFITVIWDAIGVAYRELALECTGRKSFELAYGID